jgi:hypothetical protein
MAAQPPWKSRFGHFLPKTRGGTAASAIRFGRSRLLRDLSIFAQNAKA